MDGRQSEPRALFGICMGQGTKPTGWKGMAGLCQTNDQNTSTRT